MSRIVLASNNPRKLVELRRTFESTGTPVEVVGLSEVSDAPAPAETGTTFVENALIKARAAARDTGLPALADDSGLEVDALPQPALDHLGGLGDRGARCRAETGAGDGEAAGLRVGVIHSRIFGWGRSSIFIRMVRVNLVHGVM